MLVTRSNFSSVLEKLVGDGSRSLDTETTGLHPYGSDRLFSIIIADEKDAYYFNFHPYFEMPEEKVLPRTYLKEFARAFENAKSVWYMHNAKFDMAFLKKEGLEIAGPIHCTLAVARLIENDKPTYSLADCAIRAKLPVTKDDAVKNYIQENHLWDWEHVPGKKTRTKQMYFDRVPPEIMIPYGERDALTTKALGRYQVFRTAEMNDALPHTFENSFSRLFVFERELTKTLFHMEQFGVKINPTYCKECISREEKIIEDCEKEFKALTGIPFVDSAKTLAPFFDPEKITLTEKGNPSFDDECLRRIGNEIARCVLASREASKRANTYFKNFLGMADRGSRIHPNLRQSGTGTGRLSCTEPNLQNVPKEENSPYPVRAAFVPEQGFFYFMPDFDQMEYRVMLDYANEKELIEKVKAGLDIHQATADMMNVSRREAKTLNFMLLYGGGAGKLAEALSISVLEARALKEKYFFTLPRVEQFISRVISTASERGYIVNWAGRHSWFRDREFSYKAPNYLIQGGCADVVKFAMNDLAKFLRGKRSRMILQIHDEILFEVHESESHITTELKAIMEKAYPYKHLPLTCGVEYSWINWAERSETLDGKKARDEVQRESFR